VAWQNEQESMIGMGLVRCLHTMGFSKALQGLGSLCLTAKDDLSM